MTEQIVYILRHGYTLCESRLEKVSTAVFGDLAEDDPSAAILELRELLK